MILCKYLYFCAKYLFLCAKYLWHCTLWTWLFILHNIYFSDEIAFDKNDYRVQCDSLEAQLKDVFDAVKKGKEEQKEMKDSLTASLEKTKRVMTVKADELAALQLNCPLNSNIIITLV